MIYLLTLLSALLTADPCEAAMCRCWLPATAHEARDSSEAVFTGTVVSLRDDPQPSPLGGWIRRTHVTLRVEMSWKGVETREMVIVHAGSDCDYEFQNGRRYMVYASRHRAEGFLIAGVCSRTHLVADYQDDVDVRVLGPPARWWPGPYAP